MYTEIVGVYAEAVFVFFCLRVVFALMRASKLESPMPPRMFLTKGNA